MSTGGEDDRRRLLPFVKGHGLGNDYLVVRAGDLPGGALAAADAVRLCDRHRGVGADGVLVAVSSTRADFGVRIFNPDGSEAEKSGNGLRIFAKYLWDHGQARTPTFTVETAGGVVTCECHVVDGRVRVVTVEMGRATFEAAAIPMTTEVPEAVEIPLDLVGGERLVVTALSVGNPHCVVFVAALDPAECRRLGPLLERHLAFPNRTNVQLVRVVDRATLDVLVWERGAGYTLASGSSACAAAAAAVRTRRAEPGRIRVRMPGGELVVAVREDWTLRLEGAVEEVFVGGVGEEMVTADE